MVKEQIKQQLIRAAMAMLLCIGLCGSMLAMLGQASWLPLSMITAVPLLLVLGACGLNRTFFWIGGTVLTLATGGWLALGGAYTVSQLAAACLLQLSGQAAVMHMYGKEAAMLLGVVFGFLCHLLTADAVSFLSVLPVIAAGFGLWLTGCERLLILLAPALTSSLAMLIRFRHREASLRRTVSMMAVITLLSCLITPLTGVALPPLKDRADALRQMLTEYLFYTEPRNVFSLSADGYYPEGPTQLGGKAEPDDRSVMQVTAPRKVYLRGTAKNEYTGRMWRDTTGGRRYLWVDPRQTNRKEETFDLQLPEGQLGSGNSLLREQTVTVQILSDNASSMFVPQRVRSLNPGGELVPYFNNASEIFATRDLKPGDLYTVTAPLMVAGDAGISTIIDACARNDDPHYSKIVADYTALPDHMQSMVYDLARDIVRTASSPYEKAFAIQNYLCRSYRYALDVAPQPADLDFVTNFLFSTKEGYCTYFASAMTVLCRMVGLPARYVEGYVAVPDEQGQALVTGKQGHAWTEVYFSGFGWLTFDATPSQDHQQPPDEQPEQQNDDRQDRQNPDENPPDEQPDDDSTESTPPPDSQNQPEPDSPNDQEDPQDLPDDHEPPSTAWLWWLLALLMLAAAAGRTVWCLPDIRVKRCKNAKEKLIVWAQGVYDALAVLKAAPLPSETPLTFFARVDRIESLELTLLPLGQVLSSAFYGKDLPDDDALYTAEQTWHALIKQLRPDQQAMAMLRSAFVPLKIRSFLGTNAAHKAKIK